MRAVCKADIPRPVPGPIAASGAPRDRAAAAYREELIGREVGQGPRHRLEIIEQADGGKSVSGAQFRSVDHPGIVGEGAAAVPDRAGSSKNGGADRARLRQAAKIPAERLAKAAVVANRHVGNPAGRSPVQKREACIGTADVRKQHLAGWCVLLSSPTRRPDQIRVPVERRFWNAPQRGVVDIGQAEPIAVARTSIRNCRAATRRSNP